MACACDTGSTVLSAFRQAPNALPIVVLWISTAKIKTMWSERRITTKVYRHPVTAVQVTAACAGIQEKSQVNPCREWAAVRCDLDVVS